MSPILDALSLKKPPLGFLAGGPGRRHARNLPAAGDPRRQSGEALAFLHAGALDLGRLYQGAPGAHASRQRRFAIHGGLIQPRLELVQLALLRLAGSRSFRLAGAHEGLGLGLIVAEVAGVKQPATVGGGLVIGSLLLFTALREAQREVFSGRLHDGHLPGAVVADAIAVLVRHVMYFVGDNDGQLGAR